MPDFAIVGASTHNRAELERAAEMKCDFAVLGSGKATLPHPGQTPLGWNKFAELTLAAPLPCYALGAMTLSDLSAAMKHSAQGIALQRGLGA